MEPLVLSPILNQDLIAASDLQVWSFISQSGLLGNHRLGSPTDRARLPPQERNLASHSSLSCVTFLSNPFLS